MKEKIYAYFAIIAMAFLFINATIDLNDLFDYSNQYVPIYINKDNTAGNPITDEVATLGRVLFYDKNLSANNTISCASCHIQENAFGDSAVQSVGLNGGLTGRHSMRLINARFADETHFFWDERAVTLEEQTTQPIQDHIEMGFSGTNGDPDINDLILDLENIDYYQQLFTFAFGDANITENRMQLALSQFIRSIQSFDSKFDDGLAQVNNINDPFPNYTNEENQGKTLYLTPPANGGAGCVVCHRAPEFDIAPISLNNGVITVAGSPGSIDLTNTRAPSLRDVVDADGNLNGPLMHDGSFTSLLQVVEHYNQIPNNPANTNLDPILRGPGGAPQNLNLTTLEKDAIVSFLETLTGTNVYTDERWSNPFDSSGNIEIINGPLGISSLDLNTEITIAPNPISSHTYLQLPEGSYRYVIYNIEGKLIQNTTISGSVEINCENFPSGLYLLQIEDSHTGYRYTRKLIKNN
jgi:cytochrome c peroxidase